MRNVILGGAQFGDGYGSMVHVQQLSTQELESILAHALENNCDLIDIAESYKGAIPNLSKTILHSDFRYITKIKFERDSKPTLENLKSSIKDLSIEKFHGVLIHNWAELAEDDRHDSLEFLEELKVQELTEKIGLSIYEPNNLTDYLKNIEIIQAPLNFFRRDFTRSTLALNLAQSGTEFHARSIFNQGTLLNIDKKLISLFPELRDFADFADKSNRSLLEAALSVYDNQSLFTSLVVGSASLDNLKEVIKTPIQKLSGEFFDWETIFTEKIADPRKWSNRSI